MSRDELLRAYGWSNELLDAFEKARGAVTIPQPDAVEPPESVASVSARAIVLVDAPTMVVTTRGG